VDAAVPLGRFYVESGDTARALALFRDLVARAPDYPDGHYHYGVLLAMQGDMAGAKREFDAAVRLDPGYSQAYWGAYLALSQAGQREAALGYLRALLDVDPGDARARAILQMSGGLAGPPATPVPPPSSPAPR